jgi:RNase adaptor protein for sRNA GlmZ degradation
LRRYADHSYHRNFRLRQVGRPERPGRCGLLLRRQPAGPVHPRTRRYLADQGYSHLGVATDIRSRESLARLPDTVRELAANHQVQVLFLTANTDALVQRYSETRRRHPLSAQVEVGGRWHAQRYLADRSHREGRELLSPLAESAHRIDTSNVRTNTAAQLDQGTDARTTASR